MWEAPAGVRGVIERYVVTAYNQDQPSQPPLTATFLPTHHLAGNVSGLAPFTRYRLTLTACTEAGCVESSGGQSISTPEEAPEEVIAPIAVAEPNSLSVQWGAPKQPNGIITEFLLYKDHTLVYRGTDTQFNITGLGVYSSHRFLLSVCTSAGCTNSTEVTLYTGQLPPAHVSPPSLTVLDSRSIYIQWSAPLEVNGVLEFYLVYLWSAGAQPAVVYNSSDSELQEDYTLSRLTPGTTYFLQIAVRTEESTPEDVPAPRVQALSPDSFNVSWGPPRHPNGVISAYRLWMNGAVMHNASADTHFVLVTHLTPWSLHGLRLQACTAKGCALGPVVLARTLESRPEGDLVLEVLSDGPNAVKARWQAPARPNGNLTYTVLATGTFHNTPGNLSCTVLFTFHDTSVGNSSSSSSAVAPAPAEGEGEGERRALLSSTAVGHWVSVGGLQAFSNYSVFLRACNSQGCLDSPPVPVSMPPGGTPQCQRNLRSTSSVTIEDSDGCLSVDEEEEGSGSGLFVSLETLWITD
ncbi:hypothetical protein ACEWY4_005061 [Coilia grayii]|uniref:Fibronectin type-III domain-containing protein n=1 Tax=Coilia grayii TaxID=363190 RepID=A0ABD1KHV9_9TELE